MPLVAVLHTIFSRQQICSRCCVFSYLFANKHIHLLITCQVKSVIKCITRFSQHIFAMESLPDLRARLDAYGLQLNQVITILVSDPENAQFRQLKNDLDTVIKLTEELVRSREEDAGASTAPSVNRVDSTVPSANVASAMPFSVGQVVEATSGDRPYAAVVIGINAETSECTLKYYEFETPVVLPFSEIARVAKGSLTAAQVAPGFVGQVRYATDQRWYDAVVDAVTEFGYTVTYAAYGNSEEVPLEYIRAPLLKKEKAKDENALITIPDNLKILPTDTEEVSIKHKYAIEYVKVLV